MERREIEFKIVAECRAPWQPMTLGYVGQIGTLMRSHTGSRQDNGAQNCGGQGRQVAVGKAC
jgi:hypothetical protein